MNVYQALNKMIKEKFYIQNVDNRTGYLIFNKGYYIFQPEEYNQLNFSIRKNYIPRVYSRRSVPISELLGYKFVNYSEDIQELDMPIDKIIEKIHEYIRFHLKYFNMFFGFKSDGLKTHLFNAIASSVIESCHSFKIDGKIGEPITNDERTRLLIEYQKSKSESLVLEKIHPDYRKYVENALEKFVVIDDSDADAGESGTVMIVDLFGKDDIRYYDFESGKWFESMEVFLTMEKERISEEKFELFESVEKTAFIKKEGSISMLRYTESSKNKLDFGKKCKDITSDNVVKYINPMLDFMAENDIISYEEADKSKFKIEKRSNVNKKANKNLPREGLCKMIEIFFRMITDLKIEGNKTYCFFNLYDTILLEKIVKDQKK